VVPTLDFLGQPFSEEDAAAAFIVKMAEDPAIESMTFAVAWARFGGLRRIKSALQDFRDRGGELRIVVGIDEGGATRPGLMLAFELASEAYVFHDPAGWTFHPKLYLGEGPDIATLLVGSSNATAGGLFGNYEASLAAEFALPEEHDQVALAKARQYIDRLLAEKELCVPLTEELIDQLVADPGFAVAVGDRRRTSYGPDAATDEAGEDIDVSGSAGDPTVSGSIFGKRAAWRSVPPPLNEQEREELTALEGPLATDSADAVGGIERTARAGASTQGATAPGLSGSDGGATSTSPAVAKRWFKRLSAADAQQLDPNTSSGSAAVTLVQFNHPIDRATYFREDLFGDAGWVADEGEKETAIVEFEIWLNGAPWGSQDLVIVHDPSFESDQENRTTLLRWGQELNEHLRNNDHSRDYVTIERFSDGSYRLAISPNEPGPFMA
jgi:hypothetical protein